jgi:hypothetical protein
MQASKRDLTINIDFLVKAIKRKKRKKPTIKLAIYNNPQ